MREVSLVHYPELAAKRLLDRGYGSSKTRRWAQGGGETLTEKAVRDGINGSSSVKNDFFQQDLKGKPCPTGEVKTWKFEGFHE